MHNGTLLSTLFSSCKDICSTSWSTLLWFECIWCCQQKSTLQTLTKTLLAASFPVLFLLQTGIQVRKGDRCEGGATGRSWSQVKVCSRKCRSMVARNVLWDTTLRVFTNHGSAAHYYLGGCTKWDMTKILSCDWDALWCTVITTTTNTQLKNLSTYTCPPSPV